MFRLSIKLKDEVKHILPALRKETEEELARWGNCSIAAVFYDDKKVLEILPFAAYELLRIGKRMRLDKSTIINWLNEGILKSVLDEIICHALRKLALT